MCSKNILEAKAMTDEIGIYRRREGEVVFRVDVEKETIWARQEQLADLFDVDRTVITRHLRNIFRSGELEEESVCAKNAHTAADGKTYMTNFYNLDAIISVGYRVNSRKATDFRRWATGVLRRYVVDGVVVNERRLKQLEVEKLRSVEGMMGMVSRLIASKELEAGEANGVLEVLARYAKSWEIMRKVRGEKILFSGRKARRELDEESVREVAERMREEMGESDEFGKVRGDVEELLAEVAEKKTVQEGAARLLYGIVREKMFVDGNKRIGAVLFVMYLTMNDVMLGDKMGDRMLVAMVMLAAESLPEERGIVEGVVARLLEDK